VFIEPYPKSRAEELYDDSIVVDCPGDKHNVSFEAFVGTAPQRYADFFRMPPRRTEKGELINWDKVRKQQLPRIGGPVVAYREAEVERVALYSELLRVAGLGPKAAGG
jgi:hypothetical protein